MNILLTNDDGYNAIGINILKDKLSKYGRVQTIRESTGNVQLNLFIVLFFRKLFQRFIRLVSDKNCNSVQVGNVFADDFQDYHIIRFECPVFNQNYKSYE